MSAHYARFPVGEETTPARFAPITNEDWKRIQASMRRQVSGAFTSMKMNAALPWRKPAERDMLALLEVDPKVDTIEVLPHQVVVLIEGKERRHFPSFQVRSGARTAIVDAISNREAAYPARKAFTAVLEDVYQERGLKYLAVAAGEILVEPRFANVRYILRCKRFSSAPETEREVIDILSERRSATLAEIRDQLSARPFVPETVCAMALSRMVNLNPGAPEPTEMAATLRLRDELNG